MKTENVVVKGIDKNFESALMGITSINGEYRAVYSVKKSIDILGGSKNAILRLFNDVKPESEAIWVHDLERDGE